MRRHLLVLPALLLAVLAVSCGSDAGDDVVQSGEPDTTTSTTAAATTGTDEVAGSAWELDPADSSIDVPDGATITLDVDDAGRVSGTSACNSYFGSFEVDGTSLAVGPLGSTERACEPVALMDAEAAYLAALEAADTIEVGDGTLVLTGPEDLRLSFTAFDAEAALVGAWDVIQVATPDAVVGVLDGTEPTIEFVDDGTLSANAGCNGGGGSWELDDDSVLSIGPIASTQMFCDQPEGVMDQETALFTALEESKQVQVAGDTLTLLRADGTITLVATTAGGDAGE